MWQAAVTTGACSSVYLVLQFASCELLGNRVREGTWSIIMTIEPHHQLSNGDDLSGCTFCAWHEHLLQGSQFCIALGGGPIPPA